jgi:hypothetical protein
LKKYIYIIALLGLIVSGFAYTGWYNKEGVDKTERDSKRKNSLSKKLTRFFSSMTRKKLTPLEYVVWVENPDNGLKVERSWDHYKLTLQYEPLEYVTLKDIGKLEVTAAEFNKKKKEFGNYQYYLLTIKDTLGNEELLKSDLNDKNEYYSRVEYFSFEMQKDLLLAEGTDTLNCLLHHFERIYGIAPYATFILAFEKTKHSDESNKTLIYSDRALGIGIAKIKIREENLENIPELVLKK